MKSLSLTLAVLLGMLTVAHATETAKEANAANAATPEVIETSAEEAPKPVDSK